MKHYALIVAGGKGLRMGEQIPKQFLLLKGKPLLMHTITNIYSFNSNLNIILVLPKDYMSVWESLCNKYDFTIPLRVITGGNERFYSVKNGLEHVENDSIVAIHDGVRPFVRRKVWEQCMCMAKDKDNAIPALHPRDSIRFQTKSVDRNMIYLVQTPQCFKSNLIKQAYTQPYNDLFTDDAQVFESAFPNKQINIVEGNIENIKITTQLDLIIANAL
ncbi:MAG: 2-C-methyl-D-erythritol 4-phosphate cytidylyltransferase [Bacteroidales bacterium]|jgi:2-C-methyl-D-erythritol 4-phosphate cytidylyltransferase|nr:2-C-methyl-D-erythritol 4-phosphate cytidylyltransferase [Bacteroidales bacterium]